MRLSEANDLLRHPWLPLESGWNRQPDGRAHVAARSALVPDARVRGLHQHASEEMSILAGFPPTLYRMNNPGASVT